MSEIRRFNKDPKTKTKRKSGSSPKVWRNNDVTIIEKLECYVPQKIEQIMKSLTNKFSNEEFSIFCIANYNKEDKRYELSDEYFIPKQEVTSVHIDYEEDAPENYNCVIHKHPSGCKNFSGTDDTYINQNFDLSLLWVNNGFELGQVRVKTQFGNIKLCLKIITDKQSFIEIPKELLNKITKKQVVTYKSNIYGYQNNSFTKGSTANNFINKKEEENKRLSLLDDYDNNDDDLESLQYYDWMNNYGI